MGNLFVCSNCHVASEDFKVIYDEEQAEKDLRKLIKLRKGREQIAQSRDYTAFGKYLELEGKYIASQYHYIVCPNCGAGHKYK